MGMSSGESVKVTEEKSGCTRGEARFREKRQRIGEGPTAMEVRCHEEQPREIKQHFYDDKDDQAKAMPERKIGSNPSSNVSTPPRTTPPPGRNTHSTSTYLMCQQQFSSRVPTGRRIPRIAAYEMKLPIFHGNDTDDPEQY